MKPQQWGLIRLRRAIYRRLSTAATEGGVALITTVFFMVMLAGLSFVLLGVILGQLGPAYMAQKSTKTVYAAQAGLQAGLSSLRTASKTIGAGQVVGDPAELPCTLAGTVDGEDATTTYSTSIRYYSEDPSSRLAPLPSGAENPWLETNKIACSATGVATQPKFAYVLSRGIAESSETRSEDEGNRLLGAVYTFKVKNENVPGGRIYNESTTPSASRCLQVNGSPVVGAKVKVVTPALCQGNDDRELWVYDTSYQIKLSSTLLSDPTLCITGPTTAAGAGTAGDITLQKCEGRFNQLWGWTGDDSWKQSRSATDLQIGTRCLSMTGTMLRVENSCSSTGFAPDPAIGAGAASKLTEQVVNYLEFGRCLDVTSANLSTGKNYLISYPCKQDPGAPVYWNHVWKYTEPAGTPGSTQITQQVWGRENNDPAGERYCLQAPTAGAAQPAYATIKSPCAASVTDQRVMWTRIVNIDDYQSSYVFRDFTGTRCLTVDPMQKHSDKYSSKVKVSACTGTTDQKWNAPPTTVGGTFGGFKELAE
ncbi:RICIN domain-containing protein [Salinibacterium hongtaonis]|uniref:Ricin B lectin domain-containing protein n=1 Tax=Homoserinimonas hongtaonis TaxID=2079791 RepID=A0A2U1T127_9MICO|nr:hypothetical protein [Salinibacterium hongtaonis]PWB97473.1 hypothetical protein DF220_06235 [Salinibacterium hongtaonis]